MSYQHIKQYADLVHEARVCGGREPFIRTVADTGFQEGESAGYRKGFTEGFLIGGAAAALLIASVVYGKRKRDARKQKAAEETSEKDAPASMDETESTGRKGEEGDGVFICDKGIAP